MAKFVSWKNIGARLAAAELSAQRCRQALCTALYSSIDAPTRRTMPSNTNTVASAGHGLHETFVLQLRHARRSFWSYLVLFFLSR